MGRVNGMLYLLNRAAARTTGGRIRLVKYELVAQPIIGATSEAGTPGTASGADLAWIREDDPVREEFPRRPEIIARRFAAGGRCLVARVKGRFAGFLWIQTDHYDEDEVRCVYRLADPARSVWDFDVYVEPRFRIGRTLSRLWQTAASDLSAAGVQWSMSRISSFNPESLAAHARLGTVTLGRLFFIRVGSHQWSWQWRPGDRWRPLRGDCEVMLTVPPAADGTAKP
jgi:hypothetical protein